MGARSRAPTPPMTNDTHLTFRSHAAIAAITAMAGYAAFRGAGLEFLAIFYPLALAFCRRRSAVALATYAYLLGVSWSLPAGYANFLPSHGAITGWIVWLAYPLPATLAMSFLSSPAHASDRARFFYFLLAFLATSLPPWGAMFAGHPTVLAGLLFPSMGIVGWLAMWVLAASLASLCWVARTSDELVGWAVAAGLIVVSLAVESRYLEPTPNAQLVPLSTSTGSPATSSFEGFAPHASLLAELNATPPTGRPMMVVLPESSSWVTSPAKLHWWRTEGRAFFEQGGALLVGEYDSAATKSAALVSAHRYEHVDARQTVPISEWNPFRGRGAAFGVTRNVIEFDGQQIAVVQCYEVLVPWIAAITVSSQPQAMVFQSNQWWDANGSIGAVLNTHARLNARLAGASLLAAINK
jgi:hypothetical protein